MSVVGSNARQREFTKLFEQLIGKHSPYQVWQDIVWLIASAISNSVDKQFAERREEQYMTIIKKYTHDEAQLFPTMYALMVLGMEENPNQDFLGDLYMSLGLGNANAGQFFTPYCICSAMSALSMDPDSIQEKLNNRGYIAINDPACGAGATLVSAANHLMEMGINYQQSALFVGQDIDYTVGLMCYIQLSLLGCSGYVHIGNTLSEPMTGNVLFGDGKPETWYTPMFFSDAWHIRRVIEQQRSLMAAATPFTQSAAPNPSCTMGETVKPQEAPLQQPTEPHIESVLTVSAKKWNAGQMMFDF